MSDRLRNACSFLFVPGHQPERLLKALASPADMVIADWEDAVAPADKATARQALAATAQALDDQQKQRLLVRTNAPGTAWHIADVEALSHLVALGIAGAVVPKAEAAHHLAAIAQTAGATCALVPLIESVAGLDALPSVASAPQVQRLAFGHLDFQVDAGMQCQEDETELLPARMALVMAARRAGLPPPIDGVTVDTHNAERLHSDAARARRMGFGGKLCIHPAQVTGVHAVFAPDAAAVEHAQTVVQAMEAAQGGVCVVGGKMVDAPVLLMVQRTLQRHAWALRRE